MIQISKRTLVFLLIVALLLGAAGAIVAASSGVGGTVMVKAGRYDKLLQLEEDYSKLDSIKEFLLSNYYEEVDEEKLLSGAYQGMVESLEDPYSKYISPEEYEEFLESLFGTEVYYGVGVTFLSAPTDKGFYVMAVNSKGPAYSAGVKKGDFIVSVNGVDALTMDGDTLSDTIRGELGTEVTIGLARGPESFEVTLTRAEIPTESVTYQMLEDDIAYIAISEFISGTGSDFAKALRQAEDAGAKGLIIDIRDNGGGLVSEAVDVADKLMDRGIIVSTLDHYGRTDSYKAEAGRTELDYVILVNGNSASASEILCAGVQDNGEGVIIGTQTFGKGIIQNVSTMSDGSAIKYTELQYLSPNGTKIHGVGITPDIIIDLTEECYDEYGLLQDDVQLTRAIEYIREGK